MPKNQIEQKQKFRAQFSKKFSAILNQPKEDLQNVFEQWKEKTSSTSTNTNTSTNNNVNTHTQTDIQTSFNETIFFQEILNPDSPKSSEQIKLLLHSLADKEENKDYTLHGPAALMALMKKKTVSSKMRCHTILHFLILGARPRQSAEDQIQITPMPIHDLSFNDIATLRALMIHGLAEDPKFLENYEMRSIQALHQEDPPKTSEPQVSKTDNADRSKTSKPQISKAEHVQIQKSKIENITKALSSVGDVYAKMYVLTKSLELYLSDDFLNEAAGTFDGVFYPVLEALLELGDLWFYQYDEENTNAECAKYYFKRATGFYHLATQMLNQYEEDLAKNYREDETFIKRLKEVFQKIKKQGKNNKFKWKIDKGLEASLEGLSKNQNEINIDDARSIFPMGAMSGAAFAWQDNYKKKKKNKKQTKWERLIEEGQIQFKPIKREQTRLNRIENTTQKDIDHLKEAFEQAYKETKTEIIDGEVQILINIKEMMKKAIQGEEIIEKETEFSLSDDEETENSDPKNKSEEKVDFDLNEHSEEEIILCPYTQFRQTLSDANFWLDSTLEGSVKLLETLLQAKAELSPKDFISLISDKYIVANSSRLFVRTPIGVLAFQANELNKVGQHKQVKALGARIETLLILGADIQAIENDSREKEALIASLLSNNHQKKNGKNNKTSSIKISPILDLLIVYGLSVDFLCDLRSHSMKDEAPKNKAIQHLSDLQKRQKAIEVRERELILDDEKQDAVQPFSRCITHLLDMAELTLSPLVGRNKFDKESRVYFVKAQEYYLTAIKLINNNQLNQVIESPTRFESVRLLKTRIIKADMFYKELLKFFGNSYENFLKNKKFKKFSDKQKNIARELSNNSGWFIDCDTHIAKQVQYESMVAYIDKEFEEVNKEKYQYIKKQVPMLTEDVVVEAPVKVLAESIKSTVERKTRYDFERDISIKLNKKSVPEIILQNNNVKDKYQKLLVLCAYGIFEYSGMSPYFKSEDPNRIAKFYVSNVNQEPFTTNMFLIMNGSPFDENVITQFKLNLDNNPKAQGRKLNNEKSEAIIQKFKRLAKRFEQSKQCIDEINNILEVQYCSYEETTKRVTNELAKMVEIWHDNLAENWIDENGYETKKTKNELDCKAVRLFCMKKMMSYVDLMLEMNMQYQASNPEKSIFVDENHEKVILKIQKLIANALKETVLPGETKILRGKANEINGKIELFKKQYANSQSVRKENLSKVKVVSETDEKKLLIRHIQKTLKHLAAKEASNVLMNVNEKNGNIDQIFNKEDFAKALKKKKDLSDVEALLNSARETLSEDDFMDLISDPISLEEKKPENSESEEDEISDDQSTISPEKTSIGHLSNKFLENKEHLDLIYKLISSGASFEYFDDEENKIEAAQITENLLLEAVVLNNGEIASLLNMLILKGLNIDIKDAITKANTIILGQVCDLKKDPEQHKSALNNLEVELKLFQTEKQKNDDLIQQIQEITKDDGSSLELSVKKLVKILNAMGTNHLQLAFNDGKESRKGEFLVTYHPYLRAYLINKASNYFTAMFELIDYCKNIYEIDLTKIPEIVKHLRVLYREFNEKHNVHNTIYAEYKIKKTNKKNILENFEKVISHSQQQLITLENEAKERLIHGETNSLLQAKVLVFIHLNRRSELELSVLSPEYPKPLSEIFDDNMPGIETFSTFLWASFLNFAKFLRIARSFSDFSGLIFERAFNLWRIACALTPTCRQLKCSRSSEYFSQTLAI